MLYSWILSVYGFICDNAISMRMCWYSWILTPMTLESTHIAMINAKQPKSRSKSNTKRKLASTSQLSESFKSISWAIIVDRPGAWWSGLSSRWFGSSIITVSAIQSKYSWIGNIFLPRDTGLLPYSGTIIRKIGNWNIEKR